MQQSNKRNKSRMTKKLLMYLGNIKAKMPIDNYECCYGSITKIPNKQINKQMQQLNSTLDGQ